MTSSRSTGEAWCTRAGADRAPRPAPPPRITVDLASALRELEALYRGELARLGLRAARLARLRGWVSEGRAGERIVARVRAWRRETREAIALALHDGVEPPGSLRACAGRRLVRWPSHASLAAEARAVRDEPR